jgi:uncharacterized coiled-coil DUF342 family protein
MPERDDEFVGKIEQLQRSITDWQLEADVHRKRAAAAVAEIERLREAIRRLAEQDATLSVQGGNVTVTMDATLTAEERKAIERAAFVSDQAGLEKSAATLRGLLERLGGDDE